MLIELKEIVQRYRLKIKGVVQIGSHWAEEHDVYKQLGIKKIVYVEPCKDAFEKMVAKMDAIGDSPIMYKVACGETEAEMEMYVSHNNQGQSNSLLKPLLHLEQHREVVFTDKEIVKVVPLDKLLFDRNEYNLLVLDCQGFEGQILKGATDTLQYIDCIYTECNRGQTYEGNMEIEEMDKYLEPFGFVRTDTYWPSPNWTWGDCTYIQKNLLLNDVA